MKRRLFRSLVCTFFLIAALGAVALANSAAPNPVLTVKVKRPPAGEYTMALLEESGEAYTVGDAVGIPAVDKVLHRFHGMKLPRYFRIAIMDGNGQSTSQTIHRSAYYTTIVYDYAANRINYETPVWLAYVVQFLCTCIPTLLIEGGILLLFGFDWRKNWKLFLTVNLITQVLLTATVAGHYISSGDRGYPELGIILLEVPIFIAETIFFTMRLQGQAKPRRAGYALTANSASLVFGLMANSTIFSVLQRL